jgi:hypothetical protein
MVLAGLTSLFNKIATAAGWDMSETAKILGTSGRTASRFHDVVHHPEDIPFPHKAFIVGIEKTEYDKIGAPAGLDISRFQYRTDMGADERDYFQDLLGKGQDDKMFVSHTFYYSGNSGETEPRFLYNAYAPDNVDKAQDAYEKGWNALDDLEQNIRAALKKNAENGKPYTHVIIGAMGWNNDQKQALAHYDHILSNIKGAQDKDDQNEINPLFIGLTWPSVWGKKTPLRLAEKFQHLSSYPAKTNDADSIGYGIANHIVNHTVAGITADYTKENGYPVDMKSVLIGHSLGARLLSSAAYGRDMLIDAKGDATDLLIGLQGAFSIRRYIPGEGIEGAPYKNHKHGAKTSLMTYSEHDDVVPVARWITRALHVGSTEANEHVSCPINEDTCTQKARIFNEMDWKHVLSPHMKSNGRVLHIDTSALMTGGHSDIDNKEIGLFISDIIKKFASSVPQEIPQPHTQPDIAYG